MKASTFTIDGQEYLSILGAAKLLNRKLHGRITYKSASGSVYSTLRCGKTIRVSDHDVMAMGGGTRRQADYEIQPEHRYGFTEKTINEWAATIIEDAEFEGNKI